MDWYPLRLTAPVAPHVFAGRAIVDRLGREGLPEGRIAEIWEVSGLEASPGEVTGGPLAGRTLPELTTEHPDELVGRGWRGPHFPVLTKLIDAKGMLPVHLHTLSLSLCGQECTLDILKGAAGAWLCAGEIDGRGRASVCAACSSPARPQPKLVGAPKPVPAMPSRRRSGASPR